MLAARMGTANLVAVVDSNGYQEWGSPNGTLSGPPVPALATKWAAFGWRVLDVDGHDHAELVETFEAATAPADHPTVVIARTVKGKGFALVESDPLRFHCAELSAEEHALLLAEAGE